MEKYCVSLELAQKMKELGFPQTTEFYWQKMTSKEWQLCHYSYFNGINRKNQIEVDGQEMCKDWSEDGEDFIAAPLVGELGEWLPRNCPKHNKELSISPAFTKNEWFVGYGDHQNFDGCHIEDGTEANARAKMLIYLVENKLLDVKDLI